MARQPWNGAVVAALLIMAQACSDAATSEATETQVTETPAPVTSPPTTRIDPADTTVPDPGTAPSAAPARVLVLHETAGFRHDSIPAGVAALTEVAGSLGLEVSVAETSSPFVDPGLDDFHVVVFLCTTGDVLDETEQSSMEAFVRSGGGFVGIHSAADTEHEWPWYGGLIGASFVDHSTIQPAVVRSTLSGHPAGVGLPEQFERLDEWYNFRELPGPEVDVLATIDESTYEGGTMGANHPIAWAHEYEGGRAFYTGFGHTIESYVEDVVVDHLTAGLAWAAGIDGEQSSA